jgi:hypothetical protein
MSYMMDTPTRRYVQENLLHLKYKMKDSVRNSGIGKICLLMLMLEGL